LINKRKIYLINPQFQLKFSLYVCIVLVISTSIYPLVLYDALSNLMIKFGSKIPEMAQNIASTRKELMIALISWQIGFTGLIFVICIFFSHKIAGPIYKLIKFFRALRQGDQPGRLFFRNGDYFHELADEFNLTFENIQENYKKDLVYLSEVNTYLNNLTLVVPDDKKKVLSEISRKLSEIQERFSNT